MKIVRSDEGRHVRVLSDEVCIKLASSESPRKMVVVTVSLPAAGFVPPHMHAKEEEGYEEPRSPADEIKVALQSAGSPGHRAVW